MLREKITRNYTSISYNNNDDDDDDDDDNNNNHLYTRSPQHVTSQVGDGNHSFSGYYSDGCHCY